MLTLYQQSTFTFNESLIANYLVIFFSCPFASNPLALLEVVFERLTWKRIEPQWPMTKYFIHSKSETWVHYDVLQGKRNRPTVMTVQIRNRKRI